MHQAEGAGDGGEKRTMSLTRQTGKQAPGHARLIGSRRDDTHLTVPLAGLNEIIYAKHLVLCLHTVNIQQMGASLIKGKYTQGRGCPYPPGPGAS